MFLGWLLRVVLGQNAGESNWAGVSGYLGVPVLLEVGKGGADDAALQEGECCFMLWLPLSFMALVCYSAQWLENCGEIRDEPATVAGKAKQAFDFRWRGWSWSIEQCLVLASLDVGAGFGDVKAEKVELIAGKLALWRVHRQT